MQTIIPCCNLFSYVFTFNSGMHADHNKSVRVRALKILIWLECDWLKNYFVRDGPGLAGCGLVSSLCD